MLPETKDSRDSGIPETFRIIPLVFVAALASLFLGANSVEIQAIWSLRQRPGRDPRAGGKV